MALPGAVHSQPSISFELALAHLTTDLADSTAGYLLLFTASMSACFIMQSHEHERHHKESSRNTQLEAENWRWKWGNNPFWRQGAIQWSFPYHLTTPWMSCHYLWYQSSGLISPCGISCDRTGPKFSEVSLRCYLGRSKEYLLPQIITLASPRQLFPVLQRSGTLSLQDELGWLYWWRYFWW